MGNSFMVKAQIIKFHSLSLHFIITHRNLHIEKQIFFLESLMQEVTIFSYRFHCQIVLLKTRPLLRVFC